MFLIRAAKRLKVWWDMRWFKKELAALKAGKRGCDDSLHLPLIAEYERILRQHGYQV